MTTLDETLPTIPQNREAEEATIGSVLINPEAFHELYFLKPQDFHIHRLGWIWDAFQRMQSRRVPIDLLTLSEELDAAGQLAEVGGPAFLTALLNQVPTSLNAVHYAHIVQANSIRRKMINAANEIASLAYNSDKEILEIEAEASNALIKANGYDIQDGEMLSSTMTRVYDQIEENAERRKNKEPLQLGIPTGLVDVDKILQGMKPAKYIIVAGRPGMGKTSLKLCLARNAALVHHKKIAIFSMEMVNDEIATSFLSQHSGIDSQRIESGAIQEGEWPRLTHAIEELSAADVYIDDTPGLTPAALRAKCLNRKHIHGLDLVIVDYIQLMSAGVKMNTREQEVSYISRQIKLLANELKTPILCGCQLNRASEGRAEKRPQISDLRESGALEQDADIVMLLHRPDQYEKEGGKQNTTEINIAKHRKGPVGFVELVFRPSIVKFESAETKHVNFNEAV